MAFLFLVILLMSVFPLFGLLFMARFLVWFGFVFCLCFLCALLFVLLWFFYDSAPRLVFIFPPRCCTLPACVSRPYLACLNPFQAKLSHLFLPSFPRVFSSAPSLCLSPTISSFFFHFPRKSLPITAFSPLAFRLSPLLLSTALPFDLTPPSLHPSVPPSGRASVTPTTPPTPTPPPPSHHQLRCQK